MRQRLMNLNPHSFRVVATLLEVNGRGYWETSESNLQMLRELYQEVEDRIGRNNPSLNLCRDFVCKVSTGLVNSNIPNWYDCPNRQPQPHY